MYFGFPNGVSMGFSGDNGGFQGGKFMILSDMGISLFFKDHFKQSM